MATRARRRRSCRRRRRGRRASSPPRGRGREGAGRHRSSFPARRPPRSRERSKRPAEARARLFRCGRVRARSEPMPRVPEENQKQRHRSRHHRHPEHASKRKPDGQEPDRDERPDDRAGRVEGAVVAERRAELRPRRRVADQRVARGRPGSLAETIDEAPHQHEPPCRCGGDDRASHGRGAVACRDPRTPACLSPVREPACHSA